MIPQLVVMAAGHSTRFGRPKQLEPVGPSGAVLLDYAIHDALRCGFDGVVLVIRSEVEPAVRSHMRAHWQGLDWQPVFQDRADPPEPAAPASASGGASASVAVPVRGTAHAVLAAAPAITRPFGVVNADDFYGRGAFEAIAKRLARATDPLSMVVAGYRVRGTLSQHGGVSRAVLESEPGGNVRRVVEAQDLRATAAGITGRAGVDEVIVPDDALISMNLWGLKPAILPLLRAGCDAFRKRMRERSGSGREAKAEYPLSTAIDELLVDGSIRLSVEPVPDEWMGITHPGDLEAVRARIAALVAAGVYPARLHRRASPGQRS